MARHWKRARYFLVYCAGHIKNLLVHYPDWAFVNEREERLYFVRETKSTPDSKARRTQENQKAACGKRHFEALEVDFDVVTRLSEVVM